MNRILKFIFGYNEYTKKYQKINLSVGELWLWRILAIIYIINLIIDLF